jgi:hypothetical protein
VFADWTPNNYYLHSTTGGLFSMLPWGTDQTWVDRINFDEGGLLFRLCRQDPSCEALFRQALARVTRTANGLGLQAETRRLAAMLAPYQAQDPRKESSSTDIDWWVAKAQEYMDQRPRDVADLLGDPSLVPPGTPAQPSSGDAGAAPGTTTAAPGAVAPGKVAPSQTTKRRRPRARATRLRVGTITRNGAVISTPVRLARTGSVGQRMTARYGGRTLTVCATRSHRMKAGRHTLRCRLTVSASRLLRRRSLRVTQTTRLAGSPPVRVSARLVRCRGC